MFRTIIAVVALTLLAACSPSRLAEKGKTDKAFERVASQYERNPNRKNNNGAILADTYTELQQTGYQAVQAGLAGTAPRRWELAADRLTELEARRKRVDAIRMTATRVIRFAKFTEPAYAQELVVARREAAAHLLRMAKDQMAEAVRGNKAAAREAFATLEHRNNYGDDTREIREIRQHAIELGTVRVGLLARGDLNNRELNTLSSQLAQNMQRNWVEITSVYRGNRDNLDLVVELAAPYVNVQWPQNNSTREDIKNSITQRKQVGVDSSGQAIYAERQEQVTATVITHTFTQISEAYAEIKVYDVKTGRRLYRDNFSGLYQYEDIGTEVVGDERALAGVALPNLGKQLSAPPANYHLHDAALDALSCALPHLNLLEMHERSSTGERFADRQ